MKFDTDGSGSLSVSEMANAVKIFVQGVSQQQIIELVQNYDVDGDGNISLAEFTQFLLSRNSQDKNEWLSVDKLIKQKSSMYDNSSVEVAAASRVVENIKISQRPRSAPSNNSDSDSNKGNTVSYQCKIYLQNLKSMLLKKAMTLRNEGKIGRTERMSYHSSELAENYGRNMLVKAFVPYIKRSKTNSVDLSAFSIVISKLIPPGGTPPTPSVIQFLYDACCLGDKADPDILIDMVFNKTDSHINQFGFQQPIPASSDAQRPEVGPGPLTERPFTTTGSDAKIMLSNGQYTISNIPYRIKMKHCKTTLATPSDFTIEQLQRSNRNPSYRTDLDFIYGINCTTLYSNPCIKYLSPNPRNNIGQEILYVSAAVGVVYNITTHTQNYFFGHTDDITCLTLSNPVMWNEQCVYKEEDINLTPQPKQLRQIAATGQMGHSPSIRIWETWVRATDVYAAANEEANLLHEITIIGKGFFKRGVCAIAFSPDVTYVCGIGCDEKHSIGIWNIYNQQLVAEHVTTPGVPPAIRGLCWSNALHQDSTYITPEHLASDVLCCVGERCVKFWSFQRPHTVKGRYNPGSLLSKLGRYGTKMQSSSPELYLCVTFLNDPLLSLSTYEKSTVVHDSRDVLAGADNGSIYLFRAGACVQMLSLTKQAKTSDISTNKRMLGVCSLETSSNGSTIYCGISSGDITVLNYDGGKVSICATINVSAASNATPNVVAPSDNPITNGINRPASAGGRDKSGVRAPAPPQKILNKNIPKDAWAGPQMEKSRKSLPEGVKGCSSIVGVALLTNGDSSSNVEMVALTGFGKSVVVKIINNTPTISSLMFYHYAPVWAVSAITHTNMRFLEHSASRMVSTLQSMFVTGGDDKYICVWNSKQQLLMTRTKCYAPVRCATLITVKGCLFVGIGTAGGSISIYSIDAKDDRKASNEKASLLRSNNAPKSYEEGRSRQNTLFGMRILLRRRDCVEDISDIKFSPNSKMLAVGSHDNFIDM